MTRGNLETAVILHGLVHRSLRHTVESLRKCVLAPLERLGPVEVFFHSWDIAEINNPRAGESAEIVDTTEVARLLSDAQGHFESQLDFDASMDWERWFRNNPMRHCCGNEEEARVSLMNFCRALESQERAWRFFEERKSKTYDLVVATRADMRFLEDIRLPERLTLAARGLSSKRPQPPLDFAGCPEVSPYLGEREGRDRPPCLWLSKFHSWGGVNDRFAIGNEEGIRIWSNRVVFAKQWLERAKGESSEWLLMKWLERKQVRVGFLDFTFQRVRANGQVAERDQELKAYVKKEEENLFPLLKERFLILAREASAQVQNLWKVFEPLGQVEVVVDRIGDLGESVGTGCPDDGLGQVVPATVWIPDEEADGYSGLMGRTADFPVVTAWTRALVHLGATLQDDEAVWFVEDDVAGDADSLIGLVEWTRRRNPDIAALDIRTRESDDEWFFWSRAEGFFTEPVRAFQPMCRLSSRLIREVLRFREEQGGFIFHEVLFASLAKRHGMSMLDWIQDVNCARYFPTFRYRPEVLEIERGVSHPVKNEIIHKAICDLPIGEFRRMQRAKLDGWSILADDYFFLVRFCRMFHIKNIAEFGPGDSTLAFLDAGCRVVSYEHDIAWLRHSVEQFENEENVEVVHCPEGLLPELLPFIPDLVFVDGPPYRQGQDFSRLGPCEWALDVCGCFLLHDAKRDGELATLEQMERRGLHVIRLPTCKGMALVFDPKRKPAILKALLNECLDSKNKNSGCRWTPDDWFTWMVWFYDEKRPARILQCGAADGSRANELLRGVFSHPLSELHAIECYDGEEGQEMLAAFEEAARNRDPANPIHLYEGTTREILAWMIAEQGYWESFNFIHLNRPMDASEMLADACQSWSLLKLGGTLSMPCRGQYGDVADAFLRIYGDRGTTLIRSDWVAIQKLR